MATYGATPGPGSFAHEFVTTPGMLAVVDGVIAGILVAIVALQGGTETAVAVALGVAGSIGTCALLVIYQYRGVVKPRGQRTARFPAGRVTDLISPASVTGARSKVRSTR